jgi:hypothetical protein
LKAFTSACEGGHDSFALKIYKMSNNLENEKGYCAGKAAEFGVPIV